MSFQNVPAALPIGFAAAFCGTLAFFAWRRREMPMAPAFAVMMAGETAWALGAAFEPMVIDIAIKRLCIDLRILGTLAALLGLLAFVLRYTGRLAWLDVRRFGLIAALGILLVGLAWTDRWHHLYWTRLSNEKLGQSWFAKRSFGPGFWAFALYGYALVTASTVLLGEAVVRSSGLYRSTGRPDALRGAPAVGSRGRRHVAPHRFHPGRSRVDDIRGDGTDIPPCALPIPAARPDAGRLGGGRRRHGRSGLRPGFRRADCRSEPGLRRKRSAAGEIVGEEAAAAFEGWPALANRLAQKESQEQRFELENAKSSPGRRL